VCSSDLYYNPKKWREMMSASIKGMIQRFSADRMVKEYYERLYK
jgi:starch phosphorylase